MEHNRREILRYLGYGRQEADPAVSALIEECIGELDQAATPRHIFFEFPLAPFEKISERRQAPFEKVECRVFSTNSRDLAGNLRGCSHILLFAATLGSGVDQLIHRYSLLKMSKAVVMQAAATDMIEEYCNTVNDELKREYGRRNMALRPRFSPGYGDFPLEYQREITTALQTAKHIGLTLTDSLIMVPSKSVTAVIGIGEMAGDQETVSAGKCENKGCSVCRKTDCAYRRG